MANIKHNRKLTKINQVLLGKRVRIRRESIGLTREELAEQLGVSSKFVNDIEIGAKGPSLGSFYNLIQILDVSADYLLRGRDSQVEAERAILNESIFEYMSKCNVDQLKCMNNIASNFVKGAVLESTGEDDEEGNK